MIPHDNTWYNLEDKVKAKLSKYKGENETPLIIHFLKKPWRAPQDNLPFSKLYNEIRKQTPYKKHRSRQETFQFRWSRKGKYLRILNKTVFELTAT